MSPKGAAGEAQRSTKVVAYRMSLHYGICAGPVDAVTAIYVGEKLAWSGDVTTPSTIQISNGDLFGGWKKEGGVAGRVAYLPGGPAQVMGDFLANKLGRANSTCPGFRGLASLFFYTDGGYGFPGNTGGGWFMPGWDSGFQGFYWGANQPYMRALWVTVRRMPQGLSGGTARIGNDANPAHIIYECLTNTDWGMGAPTELINVASFETVATTLYNESFGLSMMWARSAEIEKFVSEVLDHIQATLFIDPQTGQYTLRLLREDYDVGSLPVFGPDNATLSNYQVKVWGETVNEIVVTWTNPMTEQEETIAVQDIANIAMQGGQIVSDSRNYYGVRNADLAARLGGRDLRSAAAPLKSCDILVNRKGWNLTPGQPVILHWPEHSIDSLVMRVMNIDYGKPGEPNVKASLLEDIFKPGVFIQPAGTQWVDPSADPEPLDHSLLLTLPHYLVGGILGTAALGRLEYPEGLVGALGASAYAADVASFDFMTRETRPDVTTYYRNNNRLLPVGYSALGASLAAEAETVTLLPGTINGYPPVVEGYLIIGAGSDAQVEFCRIRSFAEGTGYTIDRGILDTVPKDWPVGTPIWYASPSSRVFDPNVRAAGETLSVKLLPHTSKGVLSEALAPVQTMTVIDRLWRPNRPANVKAAGVGFGTLDATAMTTITITWANRNRLLEDATIVKWDDATVTPESGQTTTLYLMDEDRNIITTVNGLTGTSHTVNRTDFGSRPMGFLRVTAKRDGLESLQGHEIGIILRPYQFTDLADAPAATYTGRAANMLRVNRAGNGMGYGAPAKVQVAASVLGVMLDADVVLRHVSVESWTLPANLVGSRVSVGLGATATTVLPVVLNGSHVGDISITGTTPTLTTIGGVAVSLVPGDVLEVQGPATADATLGMLSIVLCGPKG